MSLHNKIFGNKGNLTESDIEKYISGEANAKEQHNIEAKALQNKLFTDAIEGYSKSNDINIKKLKNRILNKLLNNNKTNYFVAIAAMLSFIIILFFIPKPHKTSNLSENIIVKKKSITIKEEQKNNNKIKKTVIVQNIHKETNTKSVKKKIEQKTINNSTPQKVLMPKTKKVIEKKIETPKNTDANNKYLESKIRPLACGAIEKEEYIQKIEDVNIENNFPIIYLADLKIADYNNKNKTNTIKLEETENLKLNEQLANRQMKKTSSNNNKILSKDFSYNNFLEKGLLKYKNTEYTEAISIFNTILQQNNNDINSNFYMGLSYFKLKKYNKAILCFNNVINNKINIFNEEAEWNKALCLLETNKNEGTKLLWKIANSSSIYSNNAIILLER